jgi:hypothetical protein
MEFNGTETNPLKAMLKRLWIISSTNAIVNYLNLQSETLAGLVNLRGTYLILLELHSQH